MPTAPEHLRARFADDSAAWDVLREHYRDDRGVIRPKPPGRWPSTHEARAIDYLVLEWDYGYDPEP